MFRILFLIIIHAVTLEAQLKVVTTTAMIGDLAKNIGAEHVTVQSLMGSGVDPHLYKATQGDLKLLLQADLILYNGLHLEGKMADTLENLANRKKVVAVTSEISKDALRKPAEFEGQYDPHIWFDVALWVGTIRPVVEALAELAPQYKEAFRSNGDNYRSKLFALDEWVNSQINSIPQSQRVLITAHDAFGYFGRAYDIEVAGLQGISTATEFGLQDVKRVVDLVIAKKVKAIFVEASVPQRFVLALQDGVRAKGSEVKIGGELFSDSMGAPGSREGEYLGMVRHNVNTIVKALK